MKKLYIKPTTAVHKLELNKFVCGSPLGRSEGYASKSGTVLSREINYWDDEEEEFKFEY